MKLIDIALKDLKQIFLSVFSVVMMFGAPLLITGLLYFAFGGMSSGKGGFSLPVTKVQVANLDQPAAGAPSAGKMLVDFLQDKSLAGVLEVTLAADEASARAAVDGQRAGVAVIIPADFSASVYSPDRSNVVTLYQDPTLTIGPGIVKDLVSHFMDAFSGSKIAVQVAVDPEAGAGAQANVVQQYTTWVKTNGHGAESEANPRLAIISPAGEAQVKTQNQGPSMIGPIMAGMLVLFVFFMGANGAESIIHEDEQGTLARLFTTPTALSSILGGKFLGVMASLCIQVVLLLLASILLFGIRWGQAATVLLVSIGLVVAASGFGVFLMSLIKNSRQTGPIMSGVIVITGMLGGLFTTSIPNIPAAFDKVSLITPQGWALQGWKLALAGAGPGQAVLPVLVMLTMGLGFLALGIVLFRKRFA